MRQSVMRARSIDPLITRLSVVSLGLVATACVAYQPGSFRTASGGEFAGVRHTLGCLDIAVAAAPDPAAEGPVAEITLGNRCDRAVVVDLGAITATGRLRDGRELAMSVYDPKREVRPATLDGHAAAREFLEYQADANQAEAVELCLDLTRIDVASPSPKPVIACVAIEPGGEQ